MKKLISLSLLLLALTMSTNMAAQTKLRLNTTNKLVVNDERDVYREMILTSLKNNDMDIIKQQIEPLKKTIKRQYPDLRDEAVDKLVNVFIAKELPNILTKYMLPIFRNRVTPTDMEEWTKIITDKSFIDINNKIKLAYNNCEDIIKEQTTKVIEGKKVKAKATCNKDYLNAVNNFINTYEKRPNVEEIESTKFNEYLNKQYPITIANAFKKNDITESKLNQMTTYYSLHSYKKIRSAEKEAIENLQGFEPILNDYLINWLRQQF